MDIQHEHVYGIIIFIWQKAIYIYMSTVSGISKVWQVGQMPWEHLGGGGGGGAPLNRFVFDICYPIDICNGLVRHLQKKFKTD